MTKPPLDYSVAGNGDPVVLIHGFGLDASMWDPQWPALQREFRAIRYDIRGFGGSAVPTGPYSHSDDLLGLLEFLECAAGSRDRAVHGCTRGVAFCSRSPE